MARIIPNSFDRVFVRPTADQREEGDSPPSVHELFNAAIRGDLSLREFAEALATFHRIRLSPAAIKLMSSTDATSGQLSFQQFQRALQDGSFHQGGAGLPMRITDQAAAIISDNSGVPVPKPPPSQCSAARPSTDISKDPFIKEQVRLERAAAKGPFPGNPVVQTNHVSAGNPLAPGHHHHLVQGHPEEQPYDSREMANTATRMFVGGELSRADYESFLVKFGLQLGSTCELCRLIAAHEKVGDGNFGQFMRAVNRELASIGA